MFDLGWSELLVIGVVALIVVGPKDLPVMFRNVGRMMGKARGMAREFTSAMNAAADETGMREVQRELSGLSNPKKMGLDALQKAADGLDNWDPEIDPEPKPAKPPQTAAEAGASAPQTPAPAAEAADSKT